MSKSIIESMKLTFHNKSYFYEVQIDFTAFFLSPHQNIEKYIYSWCENIDTEIIFGRRDSLNSDYSIAMIFPEITRVFQFHSIRFYM